MNKPPRTLESIRRYEGGLISLREDRIETPSGPAERVVVEHRGAAGVLPVFEDGSVLLVRQYRHPARKPLLEIPAGVLDEGEGFLAAAKRELAEEVQLAATLWTKLARFYVAAGYSDEVMTLFLAEKLALASGEPDEGEHLEPVRLSRREAWLMLSEGRLEDSKTLIALEAWFRRTHGGSPCP